MALDGAQNTLTFYDQSRTWRITIDTPMDGDPTITVHRQTVRVFSDGSKIVTVPHIVVTRNFKDIANELMDGLTGAQLAGIIASRADQWHKQDIVTQADVMKATTQAEATFTRARKAPKKVMKRKAKK